MGEKGVHICEREKQDGGKISLYINERETHWVQMSEFEIQILKWAWNQNSPYEIYPFTFLVLWGMSSRTNSCVAICLNG